MAPSDLPAPLTPPDCDLRGMEWMPLYGARLLSSETWLMANFEARCAAMALWWASWQQRPAASLTDDDRILAQLAGYGVAVNSWKRVRTAAMRGWVRCSDGRMYHPVVAELAVEAYERRLRERDRKAKWRGRNADGDGDIPPQRRGQDGDNGSNGRGRNADGDASETFSERLTGQERKVQEERKRESCTGTGERARVATAAPPLESAEVDPAEACEMAARATAMAREVRGVANALRSKPMPRSHSIAEQLAVASGRERPEPHDPVRTVEQQLREIGA